jgi:hypothetical protein
VVFEVDGLDEMEKVARLKNDVRKARRKKACAIDRGLDSKKNPRTAPIFGDGKGFSLEDFFVLGGINGR